jgi:imidazolonepropionase-like amidohydrolase
MFKSRFIAIVLIVCVVSFFVFNHQSSVAQDTSIKPQPAEGKGVVVLKAARLIDGTGKAAIKNGVVVVTDNKITAVGPAEQVQIPQGAKVIDLGDATLLPGFIDAHTHVVGRVLGDPEGQSSITRDYLSFGAVLGTRNAKNLLLSGFTTIRNVGAPNFDDMALRKAINEGWIPGPRIQSAGHSLGITGGHCDQNGYRPGLFDTKIINGVADGPDEIRAAVRHQVKYGADVIKTCATGGVLSEGDAVGVTQYTYEEMKALVEEAEKLERKVAAHAHGTEGIKIASRAGVASIEHGSFLDEEGAKLMAEKGTYLVPTLMAGEAVEAMAKRGFLTGLRAEKALAAATAMRSAIKLAVKYKIKIALGTDSGVIPHGTNGHEFALMVEWGGMQPMDAIVAGTMNGARLMGWEKQIGSLEVGKFADIVAIQGDPLQNVRNMEKTLFVMKNGVVYKS